MSSIFIRILLREIRRDSQRYNMSIVRRNMRDIQNPFEALSDDGFIEIYRFPKHLCKDLIDKLSPLLRRTTRIHAIPSHLKVLTALTFFASGSYQRCVGQDVMLTLSQTSVSRCVTEVAECLHTVARDYIKFTSIDEAVATKQSFFQVASFPGIIGLIDGTHIKITSPDKNIEHVYYCRKGGHSKNVQIVCDKNCIILNINARFGGSTHESYIWRRSLLKRHLEDRYQAGQRNFWLLGDSGYPLQPWLMTPILSPSNQSQENYNRAHKKTRSIVERCIRILKSRFRCLSKDRALHYTPEKAGKIITACAALHNILMKADVAPPEYLEVDDNEIELSISIFNAENVLTEGRRIQSDIINKYF